MIQTFILKDHELMDVVLPNNIQIGLIGLKPGEDVKPGNLSIFLLGITNNGAKFKKSIYNLKSREFFKEWNYLEPVDWIDIKVAGGLLECVLVLDDNNRDINFPSTLYSNTREK